MTQKKSYPVIDARLDGRGTRENLSASTISYTLPLPFRASAYCEPACLFLVPVASTSPNIYLPVKNVPSCRITHSVVRRLKKH